MKLLKIITNLLCILLVSFSSVVYAQSNNQNYHNDQQTLTELKNIFENIVNTAKSGESVNQSSILDKLLALFPEGSFFHNFIITTFDLNQVIANSAGKYNDEDINRAEARFNQMTENYEPASSEEEEFLREMGGLSGRLRGGISPEEGYAQIDKMLAKLPEGSFAYNILSEYVQAFKDTNKRLENIDEEVQRQSQ